MYYRAAVWQYNQSVCRRQLAELELHVEVQQPTLQDEFTCEQRAVMNDRELWGIAVRCVSWTESVNQTGVRVSSSSKRFPSEVVSWQQTAACWSNSCNRELSCTRRHPAACLCCWDSESQCFIFYLLKGKIAVNPTEKFNFTHEEMK